VLFIESIPMLATALRRASSVAVTLTYPEMVTLEE